MFVTGAKLIGAGLGVVFAGLVISVSINQVGFLLAGFPCQTFSKIGKKEGFSSKVLPIFEKLLEFFKSKFVGSFIFENVRNIITMHNGVIWKHILLSFKQLGYKIYWKVLNCKDFGVPQSRSRVFIVGLHKNKYSNVEYKFPKPFLLTNTLSMSLGKNFQRNWAYTIRCGGQGSCITSRYNWSKYYLADNSVYTLSITDCKKLQNLPESFIICGSKTSQWRQLGNTIPTNLSFAVS